MAASVQTYLSQGLVPATQRSYGATMRRFHGFCARFDVFSPFPVNEYMMYCFAAYLADAGLAPQTIKGYLAAVRSMQLSLGLPDTRDRSSLPLLRRVLAGVTRTRLSQGGCSQVRLPITGLLLVRIHDSLLQSGHPDSTLVWAESTLAFFGFIRPGELLVESAGCYRPATNLSWGDVAVDNISSPSMLRVHLKQSKCDQFGRGVDVIVGRTGSRICPVSAVLDYICLRQVEPGAFFVNRRKVPVTKALLVQQVQQVLSTPCLPQDDYAGHSFRIVAATSAEMAGMEDSMIQALGRWQSSVFLREQLARVSAMLSAAALGPLQPTASGNPPLHQE